jgi:hypothetical protein
MFMQSWIVERQETGSSGVGGTSTTHGGVGGGGLQGSKASSEGVDSALEVSDRGAELLGLVLDGIDAGGWRDSLACNQYQKRKRSRLTVTSSEDRSGHVGIGEFDNLVHDANV